MTGIFGLGTAALGCPPGQAGAPAPAPE